MSTFGLIWANLFRKRTRTTLTLLSLVIAFLLFVLLRAITAAFAGGVSLSGMDRLSPKDGTRRLTSSHSATCTRFGASKA